MAKKKSIEDKTEERLQKLKKEKEEKALAEKQAKEREKNTKKKQRQRENARKRKTLTDKHKELIAAITENDGNISAAVKQVGTTTKWFYAELDSNEAFSEAYYGHLDSMQDEVYSQLYKKAKSGDLAAIRLWQDKFNAAFLRVQTRYFAKLHGIGVDEVELLSKKEQLAQTVARLDEVYHLAILAGRFDHAIKAQAEVIKLLELTDVSEVADFDVLTGDKLRVIMDSIGITPQLDAVDIDHEELTEDLKLLYRDMFPLEVRQLTDGQDE